MAVAVLVRSDEVEVVETVSFSQIINTFVVQGAVDTIDTVDSPIREFGVTAPLTEVRNVVATLFVGVVGVPIDDTIGEGPVGVVAPAIFRSGSPTAQTEGDVNGTIVVNGDAGAVVNAPNAIASFRGNIGSVPIPSVVITSEVPNHLLGPGFTIVLGVEVEQVVIHAGEEDGHFVAIGGDHVVVSRDVEQVVVFGINERRIVKL